MARACRGAVSACALALWICGCAADTDGTGGDQLSSSAPTARDHRTSATGSVDDAGVASRTAGQGVHGAVVVEVTGSRGLPVDMLTVRGGGTMRAQVVSRDGGEALADEDPWGRPVLRFPPFSDGLRPERAVVLVTSEHEDPDPMSPGRADFNFGSDFALDAVSEGTAVDDGNNLMQRGLASDSSQFKIDIDRGRPSCRVQGSEGVAVVTIQDTVDPGQWYHVRCFRTRTSVRIDLWVLPGDESSVPISSSTVEASTGDLRWRAGVPLSIGGKVSADGQVLRSATDQFNGWVGRPRVEIMD
jgi:hypothetical protein